MPYSKKESDFIKYVKTRCKEHGVTCMLRNSKFVQMSDRVKCSGWFDETVPELVVSMKRPDWIEILAHEYSHLTQWVEQIPIWKQAETSLPVLWGWLEGEDYEEDVEQHINVARDLELDNEKRAVKIIETFELNVNVEYYIKKANAYIQFYNWIKTTRRWCKPNNSPYKNTRLVEAMPSTFRMNYTKIPKRIEKIFLEENI